MKKEDLKKLLNTKTEDEYMEIILSQKEDYEHDRELWTEEMVEHLLSISDYTKEDFEWSFTKTLPIDDFDD